MERKLHYALGATFCAYLAVFFVLQIFMPERSFSELENRMLSKKPDFSIDKFFEGKFGEDIEKYIADQFPLRDQFVGLKSYAELFLQKKENNDVYLGQNGQLMQKFETPDPERTQKNINYVKTFANEIPTTVLLAPTAAKVYKEYLPHFAQPADEGDFLEKVRYGLGDDVTFVPILDQMLAHKEEKIYYKTDHHWTTLGAYYGYLAFCESRGLDALPLNAFTRIEASDSFYGSLYSQGNFVFMPPDTLEIFEPKDPVSVTVNYVSTERVTDTLYEVSRLETKDKYGVFLDTNHPIIEIQTGTKNGKKLLILKDSYANAMIPFLIHHYETIHVVDLRFVNMPMLEYAKQHDLNEALILYNLQTFSKETKLSLLTR
jgi:hypothetical protein